MEAKLSTWWGWWGGFKVMHDMIKSPSNNDACLRAKAGNNVWGGFRSTTWIFIQVSDMFSFFDVSMDRKWSGSITWIFSFTVPDLVCLIVLQYSEQRCIGLLYVAKENAAPFIGSLHPHSRASVLRVCRVCRGLNCIFLKGKVRFTLLNYYKSLIFNLELQNWISKPEPFEWFCIFLKNKKF